MTNFDSPHLWADFQLKQIRDHLKIFNDDKPGSLKNNPFL